MKINGYAKGNGKVIHALVDKITICSMNTKNKKQMDNGKDFSIKDCNCKKCMRMQLYKDELNNKPKQDTPKQETKKKSVQDLKKELNKKETVIKEEEQKTKFTKNLIVWAITTNGTYKIVTSTPKHRPTPIENEKLQFVAELNSVEEFNSITENGKLIGKITLQGLIKRFKGLNNETTNEKTEKEENISDQKDQRRKTGAKSEGNEEVKKEETKKEYNEEQEGKTTSKDTNREKYDLIINSVVEKFSKQEHNFYARIKTDFNYEIVHKPTRQTFFNGIPQEIILQSLAILNNMECQWNGKHCMPKDFITQCKLAMIAAFKTIGKTYPESLEKIAAEHKFTPCKKETIVLKRRKKKPEKEFKLKKREFKLKRRSKK